MASEKPDASPLPFPIGNLFAILLVVAGIVANRLPLESARPASDYPAGNLAAGLQDVASRLWQDPFMAPDKGQTRPNKTAGHTLDEVREKIMPDVGKGSLTVLGVSVFGGPYAEDQESRRRTRYAVISALGAAAYQPWDSEKIGLIRAQGSEAQKPGLPPLVPFEGYTDSIVKKHHILILWLDESHYAANPLREYAALRSTVDSLGLNVQLRIIGPLSSDTVHTLAKQVCAYAAGPSAVSTDTAPWSAEFKNDRILFSRMQFFSSSVTTAPNRLNDHPDQRIHAPLSPVPADNECEPVRSRLLRVTNTDDQLAAALVEELANRGITPGKPDPRTKEVARVAIVYEWDNLFSRIWRDEFIAQVRCAADPPSKTAPADQCKSQAAQIMPDWLTTARFMRGLDGAEARKSASAKDNGNATADHKASAAKPAARADDRADGTGQYDYLLRLADALRTEDAAQREKKGDHKGAIRAIGVIGNDPYDKLLVLQALRPHFPDAVFFTNDLDARLLQKEQYKWTRNLLVASAFGLQLEPSLQQGAAPFRDTYQTGTFLATRLALAIIEDTRFDSLQTCVAAQVAPARLFEIGRTLAADISPPGKASSAAAACEAFRIHSDGSAIRSLGAVHATNDSLFKVPYRKIASWLAVLALMALLAAMFSRTIQASLRNKWRYLKTSCRDRPWQLGAAAAVALCLMAPLSGLIAWAATESASGKGEPFTLVEGISMWPSEIIRLAALLIGVTLLISIWFDLVRNRQTLKTEFALPEPVPSRLRPSVPIRHWNGRLPWRRLRRWLCAWWHHRIGIAGWQPDPRTVRTDLPPGQRQAVDVLRLWKAYGVRSRLRARFCRIVPLVVVFGLFALVVVERFGWPDTPYRGSAMFHLNWWLTAAFSLMNVVLVFAVLDAIRLCKRFVQHLQNASSNWPQATIQLFQAHFRVKEPQHRATEEYAGTLNDWIDVQFIAHHTEAITRLLWYPTIVMALLVFARANLFDSWSMPGSLLAIYLSMCTFLGYLAMSLQRSADRARETALARMRRKLIAAKGANAPALATQIELLIGEIRDLRRGAFLPMSQRPLVRTVLMGLGSLGGVELLGYLNIVAR